ncbi:aldehyde dehydrogenase [Virgibacillus halophilus]|uniref:Aldehyde dehydrogenase n=1 Tax=Tigheibacillus halophilus TaxID=361280 RepID=A0ABU5CCZ4_9BACI|nr:aldehyde dehydrogenase [Virgibacillus halophilus]
MNKSRQESLTTEIGFLYAEIDMAAKNLRNWMKSEKVSTPITHKGTANYIVKEPYGVTLVISPWNYPLQLAIAPVIGAIAAGNTTVLKPSEYSPATSACLAEIISEAFDPAFFCAVLGEKETSEALLKEKFDYIFFTGSSTVGKAVMRAASEHLTPVTLELGGKSPAIIDKDAKIDVTAKRLVWGKFTNAGQTCVAPDYLFIHEKVKNKLLRSMKKQMRALYGKNPLENKNYTRIVNQKHFQRLQHFMDDGNILLGGAIDEEKRKIEPTVIDQIDWDSPIMQEEIFGPLLPVITFHKLSEVIEILKTKGKPLALYYFGEDEQSQQQVIENVSFGGGCINDTLYHLANPYLPFGGVGESGMGAYHGKYSFETFSHSKSIMKQTTKFDVGLRYPNSKIGKRLIQKLFH